MRLETSADWLIVVHCLHGLFLFSFSYYRPTERTEPERGFIHSKAQHYTVLAYIHTRRKPYSTAAFRFFERHIHTLSTLRSPCILPTLVAMYIELEW
jgi:hypothetical protein